MDKRPVIKIIAAGLFAVALILIAAGVYGLSLRTGERSDTFLSAMRTRSLLVATGDGAVESFVAVAKKEAVANTKAAGGGMAEMREASEKAEAEVRERMSSSQTDYAALDIVPVETAARSLNATMVAYSQVEAAAKAAFIEKNAEPLPDLAPETEPPPVDAPPPAEGGEVPLGDGLDDLLLETPEEPQVDLSNFTATPEMERLLAIVEEQYLELADSLKGVFPVLDDEALAQLKPIILPIVHQSGDTYETEYDRYVKLEGEKALTEGSLQSKIIRYGDDLVTVSIAVILLTLMLLFYKTIDRHVGLPLIIIGSFFIILCVLSVLLDLSIVSLLSNAIVRMGMNSVMVLAMVPAIQCGISLNLGLPIGIIGGLLGGLLCIEYGFSGWWGFLFANVVGLAISAVLGYLYSLLLNRLKGSEMAVTTYVGFSMVSLMCIAWLVMPFKSLVLKWPLGNGLRTTISLEPAFMRLLDQFLAFKVGGITVPTGLLLFMVAACFLMWLFSRSKTGIAMQAVGNNPRFAQATGIKVDRMRTIGTTLSTMLGAVGILVYSQSYGFIQLYTAPRTLGLIAASAILIGGASTSRAKISNVFIGTFLFHGVLTLGMPVANALIPGSTIAETIRILVSNGIILYALTKSGGGSRG